MFVKVDENKNLEVILISVDLYNEYQKQRVKLETCEYYLNEANIQRDKMRKALQKIYAYNGSCEDALRLQQIADKILWSEVDY